MLYFRLFRWVLPLAAVLSLIGCQSKSGLSPEARKVKNDAYDYVYSTASRIPQKVRRGAEPELNNDASPVAVLEGERAKALLRNSRP